MFKEHKNEIQTGYETLEDIPFTGQSSNIKDQTKQIKIKVNKAVYV